MSLRMTRAPLLWLSSLILVVLLFVFVAFYLGQERAVHFWDYAMYANMALQAWSLTSFDVFWQAFKASFSQNYNLLFAVPSFLTFSLFGASRTVFILTNYAVFFVSYLAASACLIRVVFHTSLRHAFLASIGISCLIPFLWYPLLQGYPEHGAAASLVLGLSLLLSRPKNTQKAIAIGALFGLSVLFRRHYAYPVIALCFLDAVQTLFYFLKSKDPDFGGFFKKNFVYYGLMGTSLLLVLMAFEPSYVKEVLTTNYIALYKSYERPVSYFVVFAFGHVGLWLLAASLAGYVVAYKGRTAPNRSLAFVILSVIVWLVLWVSGPRQAGEHYLVSVLPVFCLVGLFGLYRFLEQRKNFVLAGATGLLLLGNSAYALYFSPQFVFPSDPPALGFFSTPRPPWVRQDIEELQSLGRYVAQTTSAEDKIAVVGSSFVFNQDLVRAIYTDYLRDIPTALRFLSAPESDGQQEPPLDVYATATVFLVPSPPQYHLAPEGQKVVTALASRFPPEGEAAALFEKDDKAFVLERGVRVDVWRRTKPWPPRALQKNLADIRSFKGSPLPWVRLYEGGRGGAGVLPDGEIAYVFNHVGKDQASALFYDAPLTKGATEVSGLIDFSETCADIAIGVKLQSGEGALLDKKITRIFPSQRFFKVSLKATEDAFASLFVHTTSRDFCTVALKQLRVTPEQ